MFSMALPLAQEVAGLRDRELLGLIHSLEMEWARFLNVGIKSGRRRPYVRIEGIK